MERKLLEAGNLLKTGQVLVRSKTSMSHIPVHPGVHDGAAKPRRVAYAESFPDEANVRRFMARSGSNRLLCDRYIIFMKRACNY